LRAAHASKDFGQIESASAALNAAWTAASTEMYEAAGATGPQGAPGSEGPATDEAEVTDVEYEEVDDEGK
jgi:molecular chaperone DnaK